jgi:hypothetical protein
MLDVLGRVPSAALQATGVATWVSCNTDQPAGDQNLLGDGAQTLGSDQVWNLSGLEPGSCLLTVSAAPRAPWGPPQSRSLALRLTRLAKGGLASRRKPGEVCSWWGLSTGNYRVDYVLPHPSQKYAFRVCS